MIFDAHSFINTIGLLDRVDCYLSLEWKMLKSCHRLERSVLKIGSRDLNGRSPVSNFVGGSLLSIEQS